MSQAILVVSPDDIGLAATLRVLLSAGYQASGASCWVRPRSSRRENYWYVGLIGYGRALETSEVRDELLGARAAVLDARNRCAEPCSAVTHHYCTQEIGRYDDSE